MPISESKATNMAKDTRAMPITEINTTHMAKVTKAIPLRERPNTKITKPCLYQKEKTTKSVLS
jgi:hypothetical protein